MLLLVCSLILFHIFAASVILKQFFLQLKHFSGFHYLSAHMHYLFFLVIVVVNVRKQQFHAKLRKIPVVMNNFLALYMLFLCGVMIPIF